MPGKIFRADTKDGATRKQNPYYVSYGITEDMRYVFKSMVSVDRKFFFLIPLGIVCAVIINYLWTYIAKFVIDMISGNRTWQELLVLTGCAALLQMITTTSNTYYTTDIWWRYIKVRFALCTAKNRKVMTMRYEYLEDSDVMDCYQRAGNACDNGNQGLEGMMREMARYLNNVVLTITGIFILGNMNILVTLMLAVLSVCNVLYRNHIGKVAKAEVWDPLAKWWRKHHYMQRTMNDFEPAKDIRMFSMKAFLLGKMKKLADERVNAQILNEKIWFKSTVLGMVIRSVAQCGLYAWLVYDVSKGNMTPGNFTLYLSVSMKFFNYVGSLMSGFGSLVDRSREVNDFRSFMELDDERIDSVRNGDMPKKTANSVNMFKDIAAPSERKYYTDLDELMNLPKYEFVFENVSFKYPKAEKKALDNLSMKVTGGERLAVVGLNGAGKTTFIKLLLRLYDPCEGRILLNGKDIREYDRRAYYSIFAPVFQDVNMYAFPLSENISMKSPSETDRERAAKCLEAAGFGKKLSELSAGIDTEVLKVIHDDGVDFSGGEKQKIALARALYKNAPVVVLDEPTSALDALAEAALYKSFDDMIGDKTAVYISHRLSSTRFCNHVAMFKNGTMVEYGTHESLLDLGGAYAEMYKVQAQYYLDTPDEESGVIA